MDRKQILLPFLFIVAGCDRLERPEASYASYEAAKSENAIGLGKWLPEFLPASAIDIREQHDIDTNEFWVKFKFSGDLLPPSYCSGAAVSALVNARTPEWWEGAVASATSKPMSYECKERAKVGSEWIEAECQLVVAESTALYQCGPSRSAEQSVQPDRREDAAPG